MASFDWYQSTVQANDPEASGLLTELVAAWPGSRVEPAKNLNGYNSGAVLRQRGKPVCHLYWGGQTGVNCKSTSLAAPVLAMALQKQKIEHRPTRIDACLDFDERGLFDRTSTALIDFAKAKNLSIDQQGDWQRGHARTLYIGSRTSLVRLCVYEKGYEQSPRASLDWVRFEARLRPKDKRARLECAKWRPSQVFGAAWIPAAFNALGWEPSEKQTINTPARPYDEERAMAALCRQYGPTLRKQAARLGGWEPLGPFLGRIL